MTPWQARKFSDMKDIAKTFFDLHLSDREPPSRRKILEPRKSQIASEPPLHAAEGYSPIGFLALPTEIRLRIYDLLLVSRFDRFNRATTNPSWVVGETDQKKILLNIFLHERTMYPSILQPCKQKYIEANHILYEQNVFLITEPGQMVRLMVQIGMANLKSVRSLDIWVPWKSKPSPRVQLLCNLADKASGLRYVRLGWDVDFGSSWNIPRRPGKWGLGDDLDFVRALGEIQGLKKLVISGYYANNWPAYLERTGMNVRAFHGHGHEVSELKRGDMNDEELRKERRIHEENEWESESFMEYQAGSDNLIP